MVLGETLMVLEGKAEAFANADREILTKWELAGPALYVALQPTLNKSVEQCPKKTGTLAGSGRIDPPETEGDLTYCTIGYHTPYALRQHEDLTYSHPAKSRLSVATQSAIAKYGSTKTKWFKNVRVSQAGKKAKYLEDPLREDLDIIPDRYRQALESIS
jgi:hypothetical protein